MTPSGPPARRAKVDARLAPRRQPVQERSRERVARVLDAAAALIDEVGVEAVTTNAIARRAELPVGTVYQFFPNKEAVLMAIAQRSLDAMDERFQPTLLAGSAAPTLDLVGRVVDVLRDAYVEIPGLANLVATTQGHPELESVYAAHNLTIVRWVASLLQSRAPAMTATEARTVGTLVVESSDAILRRWLRLRARRERGGEELLEQLKVMLQSYLGHLERAAAPRKKVTGKRKT